MFGYVRILKPELLVKDYECYKGFYCGLCHSLRDTYGLRGQVTLTYDMTFLVLLLSSVYDLAVKEEHKRCIIHPAGKRRVIRTEAADYAADINMLLSYYHFVDDKQDEHSLAASLGVQMYRGQSRRLEQHYPRQARAIAEGMQRLHLLEQEDCRNVSALADCFGRMLAEVFVWKEDGLADFFRETGYYLGKFIYIMDAFEDLPKDTHKERFNPYLGTDRRELLPQVEEQLLTEIAAAGAAFEKLPCLEYRDIMRNILYAGVWNRFDRIKQELQKEEQ